AAHRGDLLQRQLGPEEPGVDQGRAGVDGGHGERDAADVEHGQRGPDPVLGGEEEAGLLGAVREADQGLVAEQRALRLGRGAGGVHDYGGVADLDQPAAAKSASVAKPGGALSPRTTTWRRSGASSRASAVRSWPSRAGNAADSRE